MPIGLNFYSMCTIQTQQQQKAAYKKKNIIFYCFFNIHLQEANSYEVCISENWYSWKIYTAYLYQ